MVPSEDTMITKGLDIELAIAVVLGYFSDANCIFWRVGAMQCVV